MSSHCQFPSAACQSLQEHQTETAHCNYDVTSHTLLEHLELVSTRFDQSFLLLLNLNITTGNISIRR